jgi:DHA1 family tetracycline resistance protein-like MFS transporter
LTKQHKPKAERVLDRRLIVILLIVFVQLVGAAMILPILPIYATNRFGMSFESVTLLNTTFFFAQFLAGPFIGRLSDQYGRIPVLIVSQIGTVISFLMLGFAQNVPMLFLARALDGITGGNIIVAQAYVTDITPRENRTQALGYIFLAFGVGFIVGPAIGGILASAFAYETPYIFAAIAASVVVMLTWFVLEETLTPEKRQQAREETKVRLSPRDVISNSPLLAILLMAFGAQFAFSMLQSTYALFGEVVLFANQDTDVELAIGLLLAMVGVGQIFTQLFLVRRFVKRFGEGLLIIIGSIVRAMSMFVLVIVATPASSGLSLFLFAVGTGLQMPSLQTLITNTVEDNERGTVLGVYQSAISLSIIGGSAIAGILFAQDPTLPYLLGGILFLVMVIPGFFIWRWAQRIQKLAITPALS